MSPLIKPPIDSDDIPVFPGDKPHISEANYERVKWRLSRRPWKCICGNTNHHFNRFCADFKCKLPNPNSIEEEK